MSRPRGGLLTLFAMVAAPIMIVVAELISPIDTSSNTAQERLANILDNPGLYSVTVLCLLAGMLLLIPAVVGASHLADDSRAAFIGAVIAAVGFILFSVNIGAMGIGPISWASLSESEQAAIVPAMVAIDSASGVLGVLVFGAFLPVIGLITLAVGLWRGSATPRWALIVLPLGWTVFLLAPIPLARAFGALLMLAGFVPMIGMLRRGAVAPQVAVGQS